MHGLAARPSPCVLSQRAPRLFAVVIVITAVSEWITNMQRRIYCSEAASIIPFPFETLESYFWLLAEYPLFRLAGLEISQPSWFVG